MVTTSGRVIHSVAGMAPVGAKALATRLAPIIRNAFMRERGKAGRTGCGEWLLHKHDR